VIGEWRARAYRVKRERPGMTAGWTGSFDALEALLAPDGAA